MLTEPSFPDGFVLSFPMRTNYMYGLVRKEITEMYAFTACVWLKAKEGGIGTPFSYSVPGQPNELVLLQGVHNPVELLINDKVRRSGSFLKCLKDKFGGVVGLGEKGNYETVYYE